MPTFTRDLRLSITAGDDENAEHILDQIIAAIDNSDTLPANVRATRGTIVGCRQHTSNLSDDTAWRVCWEIDVEGPSTAAEAAAVVWRDNFGRGMTQPSNDECCVFSVIGAIDQPNQQIDLSKPSLAEVFA